MNGFPFKGLVLAACVLTLFHAGCAEKEVTDTRKSRLIAAENLQLKQNLSQCNQQIEQLKNTHEKQMQEQVKSVLAAMIDENAKLRAEIETLKAEIEKLKSNSRD